MVRDKAVHEEVIEKIRSFALENGFSVLASLSPGKGPEGNIEYLIYLERSEAPPRESRSPQRSRCRGVPPRTGTADLFHLWRVLKEEYC